MLASGTNQLRRFVGDRQHWHRVRSEREGPSTTASTSGDELLGDAINRFCKKGRGDIQTATCVADCRFRQSPPPTEFAAVPPWRLPSWKATTRLNNPVLVVRAASCRGIIKGSPCACGTSNYRAWPRCATCSVPRETGRETASSQRHRQTTAAVDRPQWG